MFIVIWKVVAEGGCRSKVLGGVYSWNQSRARAGLSAAVSCGAAVVFSSSSLLSPP